MFFVHFDFDRLFPHFVWYPWVKTFVFDVLHIVGAAHRGRRGNLYTGSSSPPLGSTRKCFAHSTSRPCTSMLSIICYQGSRSPIFLFVSSRTFVWQTNKIFIRVRLKTTFTKTHITEIFCQILHMVVENFCGVPAYEVIQNRVCALYCQTTRTRAYSVSVLGR